MYSIKIRTENGDTDPVAGLRSADDAAAYRNGSRPYDIPYDELCAGGQSGGTRRYGHGPRSAFYRDGAGFGRCDAAACLYGQTAVRAGAQSRAQRFFRLHAGAGDGLFVAGGPGRTADRGRNLYPDYLFKYPGADTGSVARDAAPLRVGRDRDVHRFYRAETGRHHRGRPFDVCEAGPLYACFGAGHGRYRAQRRADGAPRARRAFLRNRGLYARGDSARCDGDPRRVFSGLRTLFPCAYLL